MAKTTQKPYDGVVEKPKVTLTYDSEAHEFHLKVTSTKEVIYELSYKATDPPQEETSEDGVVQETTTTIEKDESAKSEDESLLAQLNDGPIEYGLGGAGKSENGHTYYATLLAGTESSGNQVLHDVISGTVTVSAYTEEKRYTISQNFVLLSGKVKVTSSKTSAKTLGSDVLGASTNLAQVQTTTKPTSNETQEVQAFQQHEPTVEITPENNLTPWIIGSVLIGIIISVLSVWFIWKRKKKAMIPTKVMYKHSGIGSIDTLLKNKTTPTDQPLHSSS